MFRPSSVSMVLYSAAPMVVAWVPMVDLLAMLYGVVLTIMARHESNKTKSPVRATVVVLVTLVTLSFTFAVGYGTLLFWTLRNAKPS